jgi:hypothetical protein
MNPKILKLVFTLIVEIACMGKEQSWRLKWSGSQNRCCKDGYWIEELRIKE